MRARPQIMGARPHFERAPLNNRGAPSFCGRFGDFLLFFMQLRVDDFLDPLAVIQVSCLDPVPKDIFMDPQHGQLSLIHN